MDFDFYPYSSEMILVFDGLRVVLEVGNRPNMGGDNSYNHLCGYSGLLKSILPADWYGGGYDIPGFEFLNIHGGITFAHETDDLIVYGLDCAHAGDEEDFKLRNANYVMGRSITWSVKF